MYKPGHKNQKDSKLGRVLWGKEQSERLLEMGRSWQGSSRRKLVPGQGGTAGDISQHRPDPQEQRGGAREKWGPGWPNWAASDTGGLWMLPEELKTLSCRLWQVIRGPVTGNNRTKMCVSERKFNCLIVTSDTIWIFNHFFNQVQVLCLCILITTKNITHNLCQYLWKSFR